jgi:hypothetical protein
MFEKLFAIYLLGRENKGRKEIEKRRPVILSQYFLFQRMLTTQNTDCTFHYFQTWVT